MSSEIAGDILRGVKRITQFIHEDAGPQEVRSTYYKLATGKLPGGKEGNEWIASKSVLRAHYERITKEKQA